MPMPSAPISLKDKDAMITELSKTVKVRDAEMEKYEDVIYIADDHNDFIQM